MVRIMFYLEEIMFLGQKAMYLVLALSLPPILVGSAAGLIVAVIQALTQVQEQTLGFTVKLLAILGMLLLMAPWLGGEMFVYMTQIFEVLRR